MSLTVKDRAQTIATFRFIEVRLMEMVAAWTPRVPEMEVKVLFGRHIWDFAQHADALGERTFELRQPMHHTRKPTEQYLRLLDDAADLDDTASRLGALYELLIPALEKRYRDYLAETDHLLDAPSVAIIERILTDLSRQRKEGESLRSSMNASQWSGDALKSRESDIESIVA